MDGEPEKKANHISDQDTAESKTRIDTAADKRSHEQQCPMNYQGTQLYRRTLYREVI